LLKAVFTNLYIFRFNLAKEFIQFLPSDRRVKLPALRRDQKPGQLKFLGLATPEMDRAPFLGSKK